MLKIAWHVFMGFFLIALAPVALAIPNKPWLVIADVIIGPIYLAYSAYLIVKRLEAPDGE